MSSRLEHRVADFLHVGAVSFVNAAFKNIAVGDATVFSAACMILQRCIQKADLSVLNGMLTTTLWEHVSLSWQYSAKQLSASSGSG